MFKTLLIWKLQSLTLCIWETPIQVYLQTVKTHSLPTLLIKVKMIFRQKNTIFFENYNLTPLDMYNDYPKLIVSNQKEEYISIQKYYSE